MRDCVAAADSDGCRSLVEWSIQLTFVPGSSGGMRPWVMACRRMAILVPTSWPFFAVLGAGLSEVAARTGGPDAEVLGNRLDR